MAIASALVPPLAVVGIAISSGEYALSGFSAVLFLTNIVAIIIGAALVFRLIGVHGSLEQTKTRLWSRRTRIGLYLVTAALVIPLGHRLAPQMKTGQIRPALHPVPTLIRNVVIDRVNMEPGIEIIAVARYANTPEAGTQVILASQVPVPVGFILDIKPAIHEIMGKKCRYGS